MNPNEQQIDKYVFLAKVAHQAGSYPDMVNYLTKLVNFRESIAEDFTAAERLYISVGFKNYMGRFLSQSRIVDAIGKTGKYKKYLNTLPKFKRELLYRQREQARKIARLFKDKAYKVASDQESMAFF